MSSSTSSPAAPAAAAAKKGYRFGDILLKPLLNYATNSSPEDPYYVGKLSKQIASATAVPVLTYVTNSSPEDPYYVGKLSKQIASVTTVPVLNYATNSSPEDPYYVGKLTEQIASATAVPVLTNATNSSPEDPYYVGKLTEQIATGVYETVLKSNKLSVVAMKNLFKPVIPYDYVMCINRPYTNNISIGIRSFGPQHVSHVDSIESGDPSYLTSIPYVQDAKITTSVYEHPTLNSKDAPHYAAAMIIGKRILAVVWVDKMRYFVDANSRYSSLELVYNACILKVLNEPMSCKHMIITQI